MSNKTKKTPQITASHITEKRQRSINFSVNISSAPSSVEHVPHPRDGAITIETITYEDKCININLTNQSSEFDNAVV